ncbi:hypothetical protein KKF81_06060 [Candidatus Micrarchaeota archaeon]|nr:hypothetical protein [Candidatus Micrarchaeota archaeon]MBU1166493.1 hypothetical protein [Candidatus Micrarchaeota archaeon]MBU1887208.1 hypothetical protein [Candidatus Micrarchaeota archaeon]
MAFMEKNAGRKEDAQTTVPLLGETAARDRATQVFDHAMAQFRSEYFNATVTQANLDELTEAARTADGDIDGGLTRLREAGSDNPLVWMCGFLGDNTSWLLRGNRMITQNQVAAAFEHALEQHLVNLRTVFVNAAVQLATDPTIRTASVGASFLRNYDPDLAALFVRSINEAMGSGRNAMPVTATEEQGRMRPEPTGRIVLTSNLPVPAGPTRNIEFGDNE